MIKIRQAEFPQVVQDLLATREVLVRDGWCRWRMNEEPGQATCLHGAFRTVTGHNAGDRAEAACRALQQVVRSGHWDESTGLAHWNDVSTEGEVLGALDDAASLMLSEACAS